MDAGIDLCMTPESYEFYDSLLRLAKAGRINEARIDASVRRILALKRELGLFERPYPDPSLRSHVGSAEGHAASLAAARESITLLRNEQGALPLEEGARLLVTGPGADSLTMQHGSWTYTWQGDEAAAYPDGVPTVLGALRARAGEDRVTYVQGCAIDAAEASPTDVDAAVRAAEDCDSIVAVVGEAPSTEKPGDIDELALSPAQVTLVRALQATGKPVVVVLLGNRPRIIREIVDGSSAVLTAYQPGPHGGTAVAEVLFGDVNPSGKLPFTYPRYSGSLVAYDHKERDRHDRSFGTNAFQPQFEFGRRLSDARHRITSDRPARSSCAREPAYDS